MNICVYILLLGYSCGNSEPCFERPPTLKDHNPAKSKLNIQTYIFEPGCQQRSHVFRNFYDSWEVCLLYYIPS